MRGAIYADPLFVARPLFTLAYSVLQTFKTFTKGEWRIHLLSVSDENPICVPLTVHNLCN